MASASIEEAPVSAHAANLVSAMKILAASAATTALVPPSALTVAILPDRDCQGRYLPKASVASIRRCQTAAASLDQRRAKASSWAHWASMAECRCGHDGWLPYPSNSAPSTSA